MKGMKGDSRFMISRTTSLAVTLLFFTLWAAPLCAASPAHTPGQEPCVLKEGALPPLNGITLKRVAEGLRNPVHLTHGKDGTGRLFVVEQAGLIRVVKGGTLLKKPFLDIRDRVRSGERRVSSAWPSIHTSGRTAASLSTTPPPAAVSIR